MKRYQFFYISGMLFLLVANTCEGDLLHFSNYLFSFIQITFGFYCYFKDEDY